MGNPISQAKIVPIDHVHQHLVSQNLKSFMFYCLIPEENADVMSTLEQIKGKMGTAKNET